MLAAFRPSALIEQKYGSRSRQKVGNGAVFCHMSRHIKIDHVVREVLSQGNVRA